MAHADYEQSKQLAQIDPPFYALLIAAQAVATGLDGIAIEQTWHSEIAARPYDQDVAKNLTSDERNFTFNAYMMSAIRQGDTRNVIIIRMYWPELYDEMAARYHSPGGRLPEDES